jgi:hypothetical protein
MQRWVALKPELFKVEGFLPYWSTAADELFNPEIDNTVSLPHQPLASNQPFYS